jgi:hypothetical protein
MTTAVPDPVPLDLPPGDPAAVDELVRDVAGAAFWLAVLSDELSGPAASAPGWLGEDSAAAAAQVVRVAGLARESSAAVLTATGRLSAHGELLRDIRREISALREEQAEDHRTAWIRVHGLDDVVTAMRTDAAEAVAIVEEFEAAEAARRRRHAVLIEELADDAAATARVLADAGRPVGGTGRAGDGGRVLAYLAAELPGWGTPELTARGRALADALINAPATPEERAALAAEAAAYAGNPAFATALIRGLGEDGVGYLLRALGESPDGQRNPMAALLASALGAAVPGDRPHDGVAAVLGATYVPSDERHGADATAAGMAVVLAAGRGSGGLRMATVGEWARQLLVREQVQGRPVGIAATGSGRYGEAGDPAGLAVGILARGGDPEAAAALLGDDRVWEALLLRFWGDGGTALGELVAEAGRNSGPAGDRAVRLGLETIGAGLVEGDPSDWTVDRDTVAAVAPALGEAVAAHLPVVTGALTSVAAGGGGDRTEDLLKGLGYLTVDRQAAAAVDAALWGQVSTQTFAPEGTSASNPLPAVAVPSAYLAVQHYGQRLAHALDGFELQEEARNRELFWNWTVGLALDLVSCSPVKPLALAAELVNAYGPLLLDMDGTFEQSEDRGMRFDADDAAGNALAALPPDLAAQAHAVRAQAEASFRRSAAALGVPVPPESPPKDWATATIDMVTGGLQNLAEGHRGRGRR